LFACSDPLSILPFASAAVLEASGWRALPIATELPRPEWPGREPASVASILKSWRGEDYELSKKIYIGNIPFSSTEDELRALFERHGGVASVNVITDRDTGRPRGFAFVEMDDASAADDAIRALDGSELGGRSIRVNEAQDRRGGGGFRSRDRY
jgi:RNA recognition motif-containing protein